MAIHYGIPHLFGVVENLPPILNLPEGKVKIRMRNNDYIRVYIRNDGGIREFRLRGNEDYCYLSCEQGNNKHKTT
tara:strand:- start:615 stop:839 length:225 start_codon:yes stop_codon:yes gene_type:complete